MKKNIRVLVVYNASDSRSDDDDPDLISEVAVKDEALAVLKALNPPSDLVASLPLKNIDTDLIEIRRFKPDMIFNLCEGFLGRAALEMHTAALWELLGIPYTGNSPLTLGLSQDKALAKKIFASAGVPTPEYEVFEETPETTRLTFPVIAKPSREDASLGITALSIAHDIKELRQAVSALLDKYRQPILVERYIEGREFNVSILGDAPGRVLAISEIDFSGLSDDQPKITGYEAKWLPDHPLYKKTPAKCPADVDPELAARLRDVSLKAYTALRGRDYGRVDLRVDRDGQVYALEFNPNPDICPDAGFAKALAAAKIDYAAFVEFVIQQAMLRAKNA